MNNRGKIISVFGSLILFAIFFILFIPEGKSWAGTGAGSYNCSGCDDCSAAIGNASAGATIYLNTSLTWINQTCIQFGNKSNVIFDCMNYSNYIQGNGSMTPSNFYYGINISSVQNDTIRNCNVSKFSQGIRLMSSDNNSLINIITNNNTQYGVDLLFSNNNILNNITSNYNFLNDGIEVIYSDNNTFTNLIANSNHQIGIYLLTARNNILTNAVVNNNFQEGMILSSSSNNNTLSEITANYNVAYGIYLQSSNNNTFTNLIAKNNSQYGFIFSLASSNNNIFNSTFQENPITDLWAYPDASSCNNSLVNVTGSGGSAIEWYNSVATIQNKSLSELIVCGNNSNINNITIRGSNSLGNNGLFLLSSNLTVSNINSSYNYYGVYFGLNGNNNTLINITANNNVMGIFLTSFNNLLKNLLLNNNSQYGIYSSNFNNNTLINVTANYNLWSGILLLSGSNYNLLTDITANFNLRNGLQFSSSSSNSIVNLIANNNFYGFYISPSNNNTLDNSISNNNVYGLYISNSNGTIVSNLTTKNNSLYGIFFEGASYNNVITNSFIQLNNNSAFALNSTGTAPSSNYFYNNYFNNSAQYSNVSTPAVNFFNITKTAGTNIVGGNYLAGNYWAAPNGSGFSQTCTSTTDGICNTAYNFDGINYDYLPLACAENWVCSWGSCTNYIQTYTCTDTNLCQTYKSKPSSDGSTQSCGTVDLGGHIAQSSGGGGGGSSFISPAVNVTPSKPVEITINNSNMDLNSLVLNVKKAVANSTVNITKINSTLYNQLIGLPIGRLYQAFIIEPGISNSNIINATINFRINKTWLAENNITFHYNKEKFWLLEDNIVGNIILYRNPDGANAWFPLTTNYSYQDNESYHFYAYSTGFSTFAIFLNKYDCLPNSARCDNSEVQVCLGNSTWLVTEHCTYGCQGRVCSTGFFQSDQFYTVLVTMILGSIIIVLILLRKKFKGKGIYKPYSKF